MASHSCFGNKAITTLARTIKLDLQEGLLRIIVTNHRYESS